MVYKIELTQEDVDAIAFVGHRYGWSKALGGLDVGVNEIAELEAWEIAHEFAGDTDGGHQAFPMLDTRSALAQKLIDFWQSIV